MTFDQYVEKYEYLIPLGQRVTEAYEKGNRWFDQMKENLLIRHGLVHTSNVFHQTAHWFPGQFDRVGDILHQRHIIQMYGSTPAYSGGETMEAIFPGAVEIFDEIENALREMIAACDQRGDYGLGRQLENLQSESSRRRERFLLLWSMYDKADSPTSYDSWAAQFEEGDD